MTTDLPPASSPMEQLIHRMIELQEENNKLLKQIKRKLPESEATTSDDDDDKE